MPLLNDFMKPRLDAERDEHLKALTSVCSARVKKLEKYLLATYPVAERVDASRAGRFMLTRYTPFEWWACFLAAHHLPSMMPMPLAAQPMNVTMPYQIMSTGEDPYSYHWVTVPTRLVWLLRPGWYYVIELDMRGHRRAQICKDAFDWWDEDWRDPHPSDWKTRRYARVPQTFVRPGEISSESTLALLRAYQKGHHTLMKRLLGDTVEVLLGV